MRSRFGLTSFARLLMLVFAFLLLAGCGGQPQVNSSKGQTTQAVQEQLANQAPSQTGSPEQSVRPGLRVIEALVTSVSDGDTVHVNLDGRDERVRMIGVNCPEVSHPDLGIKEQPYGREAKEYTAKQLLGKKVWLEFDVQQRDRYGRLLAYVWLEPPSSGSEEEVRAKMFNARLLLDGYAQVMTIQPNVKYADQFVKFQREARERGKGLWGLAPAAPPTGKETKYIGNARSKVFHRPDCEWAQKISPRNRVEFRNKEEALEAGYRPCKVCNP
ncbi:nuclease (SNase domain protein) [Ammonifex degensii KC4]|uniref:Nuclease (SNase domain protein) n=1 Tax=Ammonifex degensii (strain DSM 10501 / KC4) TaxID=429009 RepID=C9R819_AMMDK|nr:thermonuclease family protein [Ammonifex degensii]ACX52448.1 nuclease (SNase domain protein) [Ammonifex degensii KC4]